MIFSLSFSCLVTLKIKTSILQHTLRPLRVAKPVALRSPSFQKEEKKIKSEYVSEGKKKNGREGPRKPPQLYSANVRRCTLRTSM